MGFKIGNINIKNNIIMAPMAGVSNPAYIKICEEMGIGYAVTELISSEAIVRNNKKTFEMLNGVDDLNIPIGVQIFGSNAEVLAKAAKIVEDNYKISFIDINMGCPVPKVAVKGKAGSALLKDIDKIYDIVKAVVETVDVPVTIKMRSGWDEKSINAVEVAKVCEKAGVSAIVIHPRTRKQGYGGKADWSLIKKIKDSVNIPVIGNGDVKTIYDAEKMFKETNCDGLMIGRALLGNPWLIKECIEYTKNNKVIAKPKYEDRINMIKRHYELLKEYNNEKAALLEIRTHALWYLKGIPGAKEYKNKITSCKSEKEFLNLLNDLVKCLDN